MDALGLPGSSYPDRAREFEKLLESAVKQVAAEMNEGCSDYEIEVTQNGLMVLFGLTSGFRRSKLKRRRERAAEIIGIRSETLRKGWQEKYTYALADALYDQISS